jgi:tRNA-specific 2-thiouridylase
MKNWDSAEEDSSSLSSSLSDQTRKTKCSYTVDREDLLQVVKRLDIPLVEVDFVKEFWHKVFTPFLEDYQSGIVCILNIATLSTW